jgi:hypothetical protein
VLKFTFVNTTEVVFTLTGDSLEQVAKELDLIILDKFYTTAFVVTKNAGLKLAVHWTNTEQKN